MPNTREMIELQKLSGIEKFSKRTIAEELKRGKLMELLCDVLEDGCVGHCNFPHCFRVSNTADHLIAHGVKIPVPCEDCKRHTKCLIEEQLHFVKAEDRYCCAGERKDNG